MTHKFTVGQIVDLTSFTLRLAAAGAYEILHLMPESYASRDDPSYRVKSLSERYERVVSESELTAAAEPVALRA